MSRRGRSAVTPRSRASRPRLLRKVWRLRWRHRLLLLEAAMGLAAGRLALAVLPFRRLARRLGSVGHEAPAVEPESREQLREISWAIRIASRYAPWQTRCFAEALAGRIMLGRRRLPTTLYLGVDEEPDGELVAHAWLKCGDAVVTGGRVDRRYVPVVAFGAGDGHAEEAD